MLKKHLQTDWRCVGETSKQKIGLYVEKLNFNQPNRLIWFLIWFTFWVSPLIVVNAPKFSCAAEARIQRQSGGKGIDSSIYFSIFAARVDDRSLRRREHSPCILNCHWHSLEGAPIQRGGPRGVAAPVRLPFLHLLSEMHFFFSRGRCV